LYFLVVFLCCTIEMVINIIEVVMIKKIIDRKILTRNDIKGILKFSNIITIYFALLYFYKI
jgi:hypothetical protein